MWEVDHALRTSLPAGMHLCATCSAVASTYCSTERFFQCYKCVARTSGLSQGHERHRLCAPCEDAPAVVFCSQSLAHLCAACSPDQGHPYPVLVKDEPVDGFKVRPWPNAGRLDRAWMTPGPRAAASRGRKYDKTAGHTATSHTAH